MWDGSSTGTPPPALCVPPWRGQEQPRTLGTGTHVEGEELLCILCHVPHQRLDLLQGRGLQGPPPLAWHRPEDEEPFGDNWGGKEGSGGDTGASLGAGGQPLLRAGKAQAHWSLCCRESSALCAHHLSIRSGSKNSLWQAHATIPCATAPSPAAGKSPCAKSLPETQQGAER